MHVFDTLQEFVILEVEKTLPLKVCFQIDFLRRKSCPGNKFLQKILLTSFSEPSLKVQLLDVHVEKSPQKHPRTFCGVSKTASQNKFPKRKYKKRFKRRFAEQLLKVAAPKIKNKKERF